MTRPLPVATLVCLALACTRAESDRTEPALTAEPPPQQHQPSDPPAPSSWAEPVRSHLLLHRHSPEHPTAQLLSVTLTGPPALGDSRSHPAPAHPDRSGHFTSLPAHDGTPRYAIIQATPTSWQLELWPLAPASTPLSQIDLGQVPPAAVTLIGDDVLLGQANTVTWIDLADPKPPIELTRREELFGKAYDLFVRSGPWLIAIDDEVAPIYADGFLLGAGQPERVQDFELPSAINGSYYAGELVATGPADGILYLLLHYGIMNGHGHDLTALPIRAGQLTVSSKVLINSSPGVDPPVLEEHVDRGSKKPVKLAAGTDYSEWTQLAYAPAGGQPRLLISAGPRGLFELPIDFGPQTKANVIDLGGAVHDVIVLGERVFALVSLDLPDPRGELVELSLPATGATVEHRIPLPDVHHRFVR